MAALSTDLGQLLIINLMKKTIFSKVLLALFILTSSILISNNKYKVSVSNDMLVFEKAQDYYKVIRDLNKEQKEEFLQTMLTGMNFNSLLKNKESDLFKKIDDEFFSSILNSQGYTQIGDYIYKINPFGDVVYVIPASRPELIKEIEAGVFTNPAIRTYPTDDEVVGMVESNTPPSNSKLFCGQSGVGAASASKNVPLKDPQNQSACNWMDCEVSYNKFGIYFTLKAKYKNEYPTRTVYIHKTPVAYKVKCGYSYGPYYQWDISTGNVTSFWWNDYYYQNVQPLHAFWLRIVFMAKDKSWIGNPDNPSADLEIRKNM